MRQDKKEIFKLIVVDNQPETISAQIEALESFLDEKYDRKLKPVIVKEQFEKISGEYDTADMVVVDNGLNGVNGMDVVRNIRKKYKLLDIILYTAGSMEDKYVADLARYGLVEIVSTRRFTGRLKNILKRNLTIWEDIDYLRGIVISRIIEIEQEIDDVLMEVFLPHDKSKDKFRSFLLENPDVSMGAKRVILDQLIKPMQDKPFNTIDLEKLLKARNLLAHCKRSPKNPKALVKLGHHKEITKATIKAIFARAERFSEGLSAFRQAQAKPHASASE